jgi:hypothetical protein
LSTIRFLDYATDHVFPRSVGGGYIFVHQLLQDYFANLDTIPNSAGQVLPSVATSDPASGPPVASDPQNAASHLSNPVAC